MQCLICMEFYNYFKPFYKNSGVRRLIKTGSEATDPS